MRIFIDTTYILPLLGINVRNISTDNQILKLLYTENEILINRLSLFEALGKARTLIKDGNSRKRVEMGFAALLGSDRLRIIPIMDQDTMPLILDFLSNGTSDVPDAVIMASAIFCADLLLTEARDIPVLLQEYETKIECSNLNKFLKDDT